MTTREKPDSEDFVLDEEIDDYLAQLEEIATDVCEDNGREIFDKTMEPALDTGSLNIISKTIMNVLQRRQEHVQQDGEKEVCSSKEVAEVMLGILKNKNQAINQNRNPLQVEVINIESEKEEILGQETKTKDLHSMSGSEKKKRKRSSEKDDDSKMKNKFTKNDKSAIDDDVMPLVKPFLEDSRCDLVKRRRDSDESSLSGMETVILPVRDPRRPWPVDVASKSKKNRELSPLPSLEEGRESSPFPISKSESDIEDALKRSKLKSSISVPEFVGKSVSTSKTKTEIQKSTPENSKHNNNNVLIEQENKLLTLSSKVKRNSIWTSENKTVLYEECDIPESTVPVDSTKKRDVVHYGSLSPRGISPFSRSPSPPRKDKKREYDIPESTVPVDSIKKRDIHYGSLSPRGISPFSRSSSPPRKLKKREYDIPESTVPVDSTKKRDMHYESSPRGISPFSRSSSPPRKHKKREYDLPESTVPVDSTKKRDMHYGSLSPKGISPFPRSPSPPRKHKKRKSRSRSPSRRKKRSRSRSRSPRNRKSQHKRCPYPQHTSKHHQSRSRERRDHCRRSKSMSISPPPCLRNKLNLPVEKVVNSLLETAIARVPTVPPVQVPSAPQAAVAVPIVNSTSQHDYYSYQNYQNQYWQGNYVNSGANYSSYGSYNYQQPFYLSSQEPSYISYYSYPATTAYSDYQTPSTSSLPQQQHIDISYPPPPLPEEQTPLPPPPPPPPPPQSIESTIHSVSRVSKPKPTLLSRLQSNLRYLLPEVTKKQPSPEVIEIINQALESPKKQSSSSPSTSISTASIYEYVKKDNIYVQINKPVGNVTPIINKERQGRKPQLLHQKYKPIVFNLLQRNLKNSTDKNDVEKGIMQRSVENIKNKMCISANDKVQSDVSTMNRTSEIEVNAANEINNQNNIKIRKTTRWSRVDDTEMKTKKNAEEGIINNATERDFTAVKKTVQTEKTEIHLNLRESLHIDVNTKIIETELKNKADVDETVPADIVNNELQTKLKNTPSSEAGDLLENKLKSNMNVENAALIDTDCRNENKLGNKVNKEKFMQLAESKSTKTEIELSTKINKDVEINNEIENELRTEINKDKTLPSNTEINNIENNVGTENNKDVEINNRTENELQTEINKDEILPSNTEINNIENNVGSNVNKDETGVFRNKPETEITQEESIIDKKIVNKIENEIKSRTMPTIVPSITVVNMVENELNKKEAAESNAINDKVPNEIQNETKNNEEDCMNTLNTDFKSKLECEKKEEEAEGSVIIKDGIKNKLENGIMMEPEKMDVVNAEVENKSENAANKKTVAVDRMGEKFKNDTGNVLNRKGTERSVVTDCKFKIEVQDEMDVVESKLEDEQIKNETEKINIVENEIRMEPGLMDDMNVEVENKPENAVNEETVTVDGMGDKFKNDAGNELSRKGTEHSVVTDCEIEIEVQDEMDVVESKLEDQQIKNETEKIDIVENAVRMEPELMDVMNVEVENKPENTANGNTVAVDGIGDKFKNDTGNELNRKDAEHLVVTDCEIEIVVQDEMDVVESKLEDEQIKNKTEKIDIVENEVRMEPELMDVMNVEVENKPENTANGNTVAVDGIGDKFKNDTGNELNRKDAEHLVVTDCEIEIEVQDEMDVVESKLEDEQIKNKTEKIDIVENEVRMEPELMDVMNVEVENKPENTANEKTVAVDGIGDKFKNDAGNELNRKGTEHSVVTDCKIEIVVQDEMDVVESKLEDQQKKETEQMDIVLEEIKINVRKIEIKEMDVKNTEAKENKLKLTDRMDIIKSELNSKNNTQRDVATNGSEHTKNKLKEDAMKSTLDTRNEAEIDKVINSADNSENLVMESTKTDTLTQNEIKKPAEREQTDKCSKIRIELKSDAYQTTENLETNAESIKSQMELENKLNDSEGERKVPQKPKMTRSKSRNKTVALKINKRVANAKHKKLTKLSKIMAPNKEDEAVCTTKVEGSKFISEENKTEINETCHKDKEIANEEEKKQKAAVSSNIVGGNADVNSRFKNINDYKLLMNTSVVIQRIKLSKENKFADQGQDVNKSPPKSAQTSNAPCKVSGAVSPNCSNSASKSKEQKNQTHHHDVPETSKKSIQQSDADVLLEIARLLNVEQRTVSTQVNVVRNTLKGTVSAVSNKAADKKQINYINVIERVVKSLCES